MKLSINQLKYFKSLQERKHRQKYHNFIVEGVKLASEVFNADAQRIEVVVAVPEWLDANTHLLHKAESVIAVAEGELKKISQLSTPNQVFMVMKQPAFTFDDKITLTSPVLYLDDIRDPGNLGTILRIADWFGIPWVFCSPESVEAYNPKVIQSSMGAFLRVNCMEMEFELLSVQMPHLPIYGTVLEGKPIVETPLLSPSIIVIGNESRGISAAIQEKLTHRISINKGPNGGAESLNAAVATGIVVNHFINKPNSQ